MELIKLKFKTEVPTTRHNELKLKFIEACEKLDASIFEPYIDEDIYFQNLDKYRFLDSIKFIFDKCKSKEITTLKAREGSCKLCHQGCANVEFHTLDGQFMFAYYFNEENEIINDLYICNVSHSKVAEYGSVSRAIVNKPNYF